MASATEIDLAWNAVTDATGFKIERSLNNTTWATLAPSLALAGTATTYADTTVLAGTTYYYRISATSASGVSATAVTGATLTVPPAPTVTAAALSATSIALTWPVSLSATGYRVQSSTDGGFTWTTLAANNATTSYTMTTLTADTSYKIRVYALNATGASIASATVTLSTLTLAPTGFAATAASTTEIDLTWAAVTDATNYKIERSPTGATWTNLNAAGLTGSSTSYADTGLTAGTTYYYRVSAISASGTSAASSSINLPTLATAPTLTATVASATQVNLSWTAPTGAASYKVEISSDGGSTWTILATPATTTYAATGLTTDTAYRFRVSAVNAGGASAPSAFASVTTVLASPGSFAAAPQSVSEIDLSWTVVANATSYKIERSLDNTTWTALVPGVPLTGSSTSYNDTSVSAGTLYFYRISAQSGAGFSAPAPAVSALTIPAAPDAHGNRRFHHADQFVVDDAPERHGLYPAKVRRCRQHLDAGRLAGHDHFRQHRPDGGHALSVSRIGLQRHRDVRVEHRCSQEHVVGPSREPYRHRRIGN